MMTHNRVSGLIKQVLFVLLIIAALDAGCARVPSQAVVLSRTVGQRLTDIQTSHEAFVRAYFPVTRQRLEDFLENQWIPTFLGKFVDESQLMNQLENIQPLTEEQKTRLKATASCQYLILRPSQGPASRG